MHGHPLEDTYCHGCGKVVIDRHGYDLRSWNLVTKGQQLCSHCGTKVPIFGGLHSGYRDERFASVV